MSVQVYFLLGQTEGERKAFFWGYKEGGTAWDYLQEHLIVIRDGKSLSFCEIRNNPIFAIY